jgi:hypothetical protein
MVCTSGQSCTNGECLACTGCVDQYNACHSGINKTNCGTGGGTCAVCSAGQTCANGVCE